MKNFIWMGGIIIILIGLMIWGVSGGSSINPPLTLNAVHPLDHLQGNASSSVIIIEYSDFECPACRTYYFVMKQLVVEFGSQVAFAYRHFPLTEIHANAEFAARAAEAAGKQGKFWEMHDLLFEKQDEWAKVANIEPMFESYASLLGISVEQFKTDFNSKEVINFVKTERASAIKLGLQGTPSFFVNGKQIQNPSSVDAFRTIIQAAIANK
jgi:protein-disulfide isomerase